MASFVLPSTTYEPPSRLVRKHTLNTIMEDDMLDEGMNDGQESRGRPKSAMVQSTSGDCSPAPSLTSSISSYYHTHRQSRDFDDLYDASDASDSELEWESRLTPTGHARPRSVHSDTSRPQSWASSGSRNRYPSLVIPSPSHWPTIHNFPKSSPIPPTPPAKIVISPQALKLLSPHVLTSSATPSLDGSLSSDQVASISAPATPDIPFNAADMTSWGDRVEVADSNSDYQDDVSAQELRPIEIPLEDSVHWSQPKVATTHRAESFDLPEKSEPLVSEPKEDEVDIDIGVQLPAGALDTLRHLSYDPISEPQSAVEEPVYREMQEVSKLARRSSADMTPASATSDYSFTQLSVPSPGDFFSSLGPNARHTWCVYKSEPSSAAPPSSATAEHFYNAPWNEIPNRTVEHILEIKDDRSEGPPTAIRVPILPSPSPRSFKIKDKQAGSESNATVKEADAKKPINDYDEDYEKEIWQSAESTLDRTSMWLAAQTTYMAALRETNPTNVVTADSGLASRRASKHLREDSLDSPMKKAVKFLDSQIAKAEAGKQTPSSKADPLFYQAFQHMSNSSSPTDSFVHRHARYDALQACRASLVQHHLDQLLGNYHTTDANRPAPQRPISMMPGKGEVEETAEQRVIARVERERQAVEQVTPAMWIVEAIRYLSGGRLLNSPVTSVLSQAPPLHFINLPDHVRVLDLGGQAQCDWAWHCAREFPNVKTYTATSDQRTSGLNLRGPSNHRLVSVTNLWELPFPDNHFDAISARSLFTFLKNEKPLGASVDQYDMCLKECLRCLKPGGYLEFFILDSEIVHAGPQGTAASVQFGFNLKSRGYDPAPTKSWLSRIRKAGLSDIKRAWMFLPMGTIQESAYMPPETPPPHVSMYEDKIAMTEAVQGPVGSKADASHISGLVGSWAWEQWLLKLEMEMGKTDGGLIPGVGAVLEEGKKTGAGWRCLSGWARKPM